MNKIISVIKFIAILLLKILFSTLVIYFLSILGLDYNNINQNIKIIINIIADLIIMFIFYMIYRKDLKNDFIDYKKNYKKYFISGLKLWALGLIVMMISNNIIQLFINQTSTNENIIQSYIASYPIYMLFQTIFFAPFTEEITYRKALRDIFSNDVLYIIVSGLAFGFIHTISGLNSATELLFIIPYGFMGSCFAYLYVKTKNIYSSITIHMIHNAILIAMSILLLLIGG